MLRWLREIMLPTPDDPDDARKCYTCPKRRWFERWCDRHDKALPQYPNAGPCLRPDFFEPELAAPPYSIDLAGCLERVCAGTGTAADARRIGRWLPQSAACAFLERERDQVHGEVLLRELMQLEEILRAVGVPVVFPPRRPEAELDALLSKIDSTEPRAAEPAGEIEP